MLWVITVIKQDGDLGKFKGFCLEVSNVLNQPLQQARIIRHIGWSTVRKKGKPQRIHREMPLNPIRRFVEAKAFRVHTRIASILHRLGVNDQQGRPLGFFLTCSRT